MQDTSNTEPILTFKYPGLPIRPIGPGDDIAISESALDKWIELHTVNAVLEARIDELLNFGEDEGSSGAYYLKINGGNLRDRIKFLKQTQEPKEV